MARADVSGAATAGAQDSAYLRATAVRLGLINDKTPDELGIWAYYGGVSDAGLAVVGRVLGISAYAASTGATVSINGGDAIPVPPSGGFALDPRGNLLDPTIVFAGTDAYFVEVVT